MPNTITSAGILANVYNNRALITHNFDNKSIIRTTDGKLWAAIRENLIAHQISIYYSDDDGFSWQRAWNGTFTTSTNRKADIAGLNTNGPHMTLQVFEDLNYLVLWHAYYNVSATDYNVEPFTFDISNPDAITRVTTDMVTEIGLDADQMAVDAIYNQKTVYLSYVYLNNLRVKQYRPTYQTASESTVTHTGSYFNIFSGIAHRDGYVDYLILANTGVGSYKVVHTRYTESTQSFSVDHNVHVLAGNYDATDLTISRDGYGNLLAFWGQFSATGADIDTMYSLSSDGGTTWSTATVINKTAGHSAYSDTVVAQLSTRATSIGGIKGFLLAYTRNNSAGIPKTWVRHLSTTDGSNYVMGNEQPVGSSITQADDAVVGLRWFRPPGGTLLDLTDPGLVRVAFQVGQGNSTLQNDTRPIRICQELLSSSSFPNQLASDAGQYTTDVPSSEEILVTVNVLGGPSENVDYYSAGLTGGITNRYISAFSSVGVHARIFKYEPVVTSQMDDRSAYGAPTEYSTRIVLDAQTYELPLADRGNDGFTNYMERDIRKIYLPPDFHLERDFVVNDGNFLKRTVWTVFFDGNEYEITQVVPFFIQQQIAYYNANAYVIGPSNNPFSRRTLPSET